MKSNIKINTLRILILVLFLSLSMALLPMISNSIREVKADNNTFYMEEGASIKVKEDAAGKDGIRFIAYLTKDMYDLVKDYDNVTYNTLVCIDPNLSEDEIKVENISDTLKSYPWNKQSFSDSDFTNEIYTQYIRLLFGEKYYDKQITVKPYIHVPKQADLENDLYYYCTLNNNTRSMMDVANAAIMGNPTYQQTLSRYLGGRTVVEETAKNYIETLSGSESANTFAFTTDGNINLTNPAVKLGARDITASSSVSGNKVTISNDILSTLTLGETYKLSVVTSDTIYRSEFMYVSKAIKTKEDMQVFSMDTLRLIEGYYVLANDIDMQGTSVSHSSMTDSTSDKDYSFQGTFDGNGYTLKTVVGRYGIFGALKKAVVKNVNIIVNGIDGTNGANVFSYRANIANAVYSDRINITNVNVDIQTDSPCTLYGNHGKQVYHENVIVNIADSAQKEQGVLISTAVNWAALTTSSNTYVINSNAQYPLFTNGDSTTYWADNESVENKYEGVERYASLNALKTSENSFDSFDDNFWDVTSLGVPVWKGTVNSLLNIYVNDKQADSIELNVGDEASVKYSAGTIDVDETFEVVSGDCVSIKDGVLTATTIGAAVIKASVTLNEGTNKATTYEKTMTVSVVKPTVVIEETVELFSVADGLANGQDIKTFVNNEEIVAVSQEGNENITYTDGKLLNVVPSIVKDIYNQLNTTVNTVTVTIETTTKIYELKLMAYTKVILTTEDMDAVKCTQTNGIIEGYYILGADVNAENFVHDRYDSAATTSFKGVFDGNGKTITFKASTQGLFLFMRQAAVKNLTINVTGVRSTSKDCYIITHSSGTGGSSTAVMIENVTIDYSKVTTNAGCYVIGGMGTQTHFKNVTINAGNVNAGSGNIFAIASGWIKTTNVTFTNTKVITTCTGALMSNQDSNDNKKYTVYYAENDTNVPVSGDGSSDTTPVVKVYAGLTREVIKAE